MGPLSAFSPTEDGTPQLELGRSSFSRVRIRLPPLPCCTLNLMFLALRKISGCLRVNSIAFLADIPTTCEPLQHALQCSALPLVRGVNHIICSSHHNTDAGQLTRPRMPTCRISTSGSSDFARSARGSGHKYSPPFSLLNWTLPCSHLPSSIRQVSSSTTTKALRVSHFFVTHSPHTNTHTHTSRHLLCTPIQNVVDRIQPDNHPLPAGPPLGRRARRDHDRHGRPPGPHPNGPGPQGARRPLP